MRPARPIPEVLLLRAKAAGLDDVSCVRAWGKYLGFCDRTGRQDYSEHEWDENVRWEKARLRGTQTRPSGPVPADPWSPGLAAQRAAQAQREASYKREAVTMAQWASQSPANFAAASELRAFLRGGLAGAPVPESGERLTSEARQQCTRGAGSNAPASAGGGSQETAFSAEEEWL